jgi:4-amino-4-deoxy-L-arabinose transferase-like glycosyltransferase
VSGRQFTLFLQFACILFIARLAVLLFFAPDLFADEAQYWYWSKHLDFGYYSKPPGIALAIAVSTALFGDTEWAIRLPALFFYTMTAFWIYDLAAKIYNSKIALFSGLGFLLLPGVAVGSMVAATDALLLFFWAMALWGLVMATKEQKIYGWYLMGCGIGLGLLSKYTMVFFYPCLLLYVLFSPPIWKAHQRHIVIALMISVLLFLPNVYWNWQHGFITLWHTAQISHLQQRLIHPGEFLEFFGAQFGVFGPLFFTAFFFTIQKAWANPTDRLLVIFSWIPLSAFLLLAFLARALANWAAPAYIAALPLVIAWMMQRPRFFSNAFFINASMALMVMVFEPLNQAFALPKDIDPAKRMRGWRALGHEVQHQLAQAPQKPVILVDNRRLAAELLYYVRPMPELVRWNPQGLIRDTFDLQTSMQSLSNRLVLYLSDHPVCPPCSFFADHPSAPIPFRVHQQTWYAWWLQGAKQ